MRLPNSSGGICKSLPEKRWEHGGNGGPVLSPLQLFHILGGLPAASSTPVCSRGLSTLCRAQMLSVNVGGCGAQVKTGAGNFFNHLRNWKNGDRSILYCACYSLPKEQFLHNISDVTRPFILHSFSHMSHSTI